MKKERNSDNQDRLLELPNPYKGVTLEVFSDLLTDRPEFARKAFTQLGQENPFLAKFIVRNCIASINREIALDWCLAYYEIFARSARRNGQQILLVEENTMKSFFDEELQDIEFAKKQGNLAMNELMRERSRLLEKAIDDDVRQNEEELGEFWTTLTQYRMQRLYNGKIISEEHLSATNQELENTFQPLLILRSLLHAQARSNRLKKRFPGS